MAEKITILAIDDEKDTLYTLGEICQFQGWTPFLVENYAQAEMVLNRETPSIILVDYHMPGVDGVTAVTRIRRRCPRVPVIVLTSEESREVLDRFLAAGADDYALKPIRVIDLISRIRAHLQFQQRTQHLTEYDKNISEYTLTMIENYLKQQNDYVTVDAIAEGTEIKKKTVYRYLQYLMLNGCVENRSIYGSKGRPKVCYMWKGR